MKRFHVHVAVDDLAANVRFYSSVFGMPPTVEKPDYAKWMMEDPRINFAISTHGNRKAGIDHLGLQVDTDEELRETRKQIDNAEIAALDHDNATCCYANSDKYWITDPQGVAWETFHTLGSVPMYGESTKQALSKPEACCAAAPVAAAQTEKPGACCS